MYEQCFVNGHRKAAWALLLGRVQIVLEGVSKVASQPHTITVTAGIRLSRFRLAHFSLLPPGQSHQTVTQCNPGLRYDLLPSTE